MSTLEKAPLIEAIFELRWGKKAHDTFEYEQEEQALFAGQISSAATTNGYKATELVNPDITPFSPIPMVPTHRFRKEPGTWPCLQIGLGIFTINQINDGYDWNIFKEAIREGCLIFQQANLQKLEKVKDSLSFILKYQDFFASDEITAAQKFLKEKLNVSINLPEAFLKHESLSNEIQEVNLIMKTPSKQPVGTISIMITNAKANGNPGFLMETTVESSAKNITHNITIDNIVVWAEEAHNLQRHSFNTLIKEEAY